MIGCIRCWKKSSNGKMLLEECRKANPNTVFISEVKEITEPLPEDVGSVRGVRGHIHSEVADGRGGCAYS